MSCLGKIPFRLLQSALTGESLPVTKGPGDGVYSGSTCKQGEIEAVVIATGVHTFFGKAAHLVDTTNQVGHFQKVRGYERKILHLKTLVEKEKGIMGITRKGKWKCTQKILANARMMEK